MSNPTTRGGKTLLQIAREAKTKGSYVKQTDEEMLELAVAWLKGEITTGQATTAIKGAAGQKKHSTSVLFQLCISVREAIKRDQLEVKIKKNV